MQVRPLPRLLVLAHAFAMVFTLHVARAADPLEPRAVPEPLKSWTAWVLDGSEEHVCPTFHAHSEISRCVWPSRIELTLGDHEGRFTQHWHADARRWVVLPGSDKRWPLDAAVDGKRAVVVARDAGPSVELGRGDHTVSGSFAWDSLPESIAIPPETGLLALTVRGKVVDSPVRDATGAVWLEKTAENEEGNALELVVHRKIVDDIPLLLVTRIELHVSGKNREELLGRALPAGFVPRGFDSPLPARLEPDGRLRVQVRPGIHTLELTSRSTQPITSLSRPEPDGPWREGEEVWTFEAKNDYRVVAVEGVPALDPQQTTLPDAWKRLPAYPMRLGATLRLVETRRGDQDPPPDQLALTRALWLDFDGRGYSARDVVRGTVSRDGRLAMASPTILGRVAMVGADQFITRLSPAPEAGVEVRKGELDLTADSRIPGEASEVPAVSWAHDFHQVSGTLHLPPGWRLVHAAGVDDVPGTWLRQWSLLQIFLALIVAIAIGRLHGSRWGAIALVLLVLTLPEKDAPRWSWSFVLAVDALLRVLPPGKLKKAFEGARIAALLTVALIALPFAIEHVRQGLYPALTSVESAAGSPDSEAGGDVAGLFDMEKGANKAAAPPPAANPNDEEAQQKVAAAPSPQSARPGAGGLAGLSSFGASGAPSPKAIQRQSNAQIYDPNAMVQTGAGVPHWRWTSHELRWSGPVAATQRLRLYLLSPPVNLALAFLRAALLVVVFLRLLPWTQRMFPGRWAPAAAATVLFLVLPSLARADIPDKPTLDELKERLTRGPSCRPTCASSSRMTIGIRGGNLRARLEVEASADTAVPLPGSRDQWSPTRVLLDGKPAPSLVRLADGTLWMEVTPGAHQVLLEGVMPDRESVQLPLPLKPHRVAVTSEGWTVAGVHEDGLADDDLQLTRVRTGGEGSGGSLQPGVLPPFVRVERTLQVGLDWQVDTRLVRVTPPGAAVVLEVPLLAGESVTTADVRVVGGKALVNMGPQVTSASWHSVLDPKSPVRLAAPRSSDWVEVWRVDVGPIWHASFSGIPSVHTQSDAGSSVPEWRPWPGERVDIDLARPEGVPGQTLTIDASEERITPGLRATDISLTLSIRSSRGAQHTVTLPPDAQLESISINGVSQPIRTEGRKLTLPIVPGAQHVLLAWRQTPGIAALFGTPPVDLGAPSVNATISLIVPGGRWLLFAGGPRIGPAVLFWSQLFVLLVLSLLLGRNRWTPLRWWHWLLLAVGLSQVSVVSGAIFVGWMIALGWRSREGWTEKGALAFNARQVAFVAWTLVALGILCVSLYQGLLGAPEMQVQGNGSDASTLRWFVDRAGPTLPPAWIVSVPVLAYRCAMLGWALWSALALLGWLGWAWGAFTTGGAWKKVVRPPPPARPPMTTMPFGPPGPGPTG